jgi:hypothetical protein
VVTSTERVVPDSRTAGAHLEALAVQLGRAGLSARLTRPIGRPPTLYVLSPDQPQLEERVMIDQSENGTWWFWWDWSDGIAPATEMAEAAESIRRVVSAN